MVERGEEFRGVPHARIRDAETPEFTAFLLPRSARARPRRTGKLRAKSAAPHSNAARAHGMSIAMDRVHPRKGHIMRPESIRVPSHPAYVQRGRAASACGQHINVRDPAEVARRSRELGITWAQLFRIIDRVGTNLRAVRSAVLNDQGVVWH